MTIVGDIMHSRVAVEHLGLETMGARCGSSARLR